VSQVSTDFNSPIFLLISSKLTVGVIMPGSGNAIGFHIFCMNSNQSLGTSCWDMTVASSRRFGFRLYHSPLPVFCALRPITAIGSNPHRQDGNGPGLSTETRGAAQEINCYVVCLRPSAAANLANFNEVAGYRR
jgi:hypothetical protein